MRMKNIVFAITLNIGLLSLAWAQSDTGSKTEQLLFDFYDYSLALKVDRSIPNVRVFDSGRVEINIPAYKRDAGHYELQSGPADHQALSDLIRQFSKVDSVQLLEQAEATRLAKSTDTTQFHSSQSRMTRIVSYQDQQPQEWVFLNLNQYSSLSTSSVEFDSFRSLVQALRSLQWSQQRQWIGEISTKALPREAAR